MNGRELYSYKDGTNKVVFKYNADGNRIAKKFNGQEIYYYLEGKTIIFESRNGTVLYYIYNGDELLGFRYNNKTYYYHKNMFGDIIGIFDSNYKEIVTYEYDSWGSLINITDISNINLGEINPFRYRSYYYDTETKLYYLNSRYYNPEIGRFINGDSLLLANQDIISANVFQYVSNNPIINSDYSGHNAISLPWNNMGSVIGGLGGLAGLGSSAIAGLGAFASVIAIIAATATAISTAVSYSKTKQKKKSQSNNNPKGHTVYALVDKGNIAQYVGRTTDVRIRANAHLRNPNRKILEMHIIKDELNIFEARGVEQTLIEYCNVLNKGSYMHNQINGIKLWTDNYYDFTRMGRKAFDHTIIPIYGDKCYIDPLIYPAVN